MKRDTSETRHNLLAKTLSVISIPVLTLAILPVNAQESRRQIEEVIVTAEKVEATVSDTSISITAFNAEMIDDFGMQGADDMVDFIPATTRDAYDIRIRGVGRNFRALGGDAGVATYYNSVFSPDFGIAASENALYDVARIEVLRGPQGTLYGRNSIGGALNYVTNEPTFDWSGNVRAQLGDLNTREWYGVISGPIIDDTLAFRLLGVKRDRDGAQEGLFGTDDLNSTDDQNIAVSLLWNITDALSIITRANDRESDRVINGSALIDEGPSTRRGVRSTDVYAYGLRASATGPFSFTDPRDGSIITADYNRPGVDVSPTHVANGAFGQTDSAALMAGATRDDPNNTVMSNNDGTGACQFPYTLRNCNHELFEHSSNQTEINWDLSDRTSLKYIFGYTDFKYTFNIDGDYANSDFNKSRQTVLEDVQSKSHELQLFWSVGDNWTATSGIFYSDEMRKQDYSLTNTIPRYTQAANYGAFASPTPAFIGVGGASINQLLAFRPNHVRLDDAPEGQQILGLWEGDPKGDYYHHKNTVDNKQSAIYTQGTYTFNDEFAIVLGIRYAEDKKNVDEIRGGYFELGPATLGFANGILPFLSPSLGLAVAPGFFPVTPGLTPLALYNIAMGNGTYSGDPANPLTPTCALTAPTCATPLRLTGVPYSFTSTIRGGDTWSDTNFRVNLDWTPNDDILMYFSVTTGYRSGGFSLGVVDARLTDPATLGLVARPYDQEEVTSYEIGYKGLHVDNTLQLNMSLYTYQYDNYQDEVNAFDPQQNDQIRIVQNAGKAVNSGFEIEALWLPTDALTLGGNYSFTKTKYDSDYFIGLDDDPSLPASLFGNAETAPELFGVNAKGSPLKKIPEHKATAWMAYLWPTTLGDFTFRSSYSYTGEYFDQGFERALDLVPSRIKLDVSLAWQDAEDRWTVRGFVDNVTDEHNLRDVDSATEAGNWRLSGAILATRYWGLDVTYRFGAM